MGAYGIRLIDKDLKVTQFDLGEAALGGRPSLEGKPDERSNAVLVSDGWQVDLLKIDPKAQ